MARRRRPPRPGALADLSPLRILTQIALLLLLFYSSITFLYLLTSLLSGTPFAAAQLLGWRALRVDNAAGATLALLWALNALVGAAGLLVVVRRSKLVLDFTLTVYGVHLCVVGWWSGGVPRSVAWWGVQAVGVGVMLGAGGWACRWRELRPIKFGGGGGTAAQEVAGGEGSADDGVTDLELGLGRGGRRGRGRDGAGEYEMVGMKSSSSGET